MVRALIKLAASAILFSTAVTAQTFPRGCNEDNCLRAIFGTRPPNTNQPRPDATSRSADCSSFQSITVIPPATTSTVAFTPGAKVKRQAGSSTTIRPSNVPPYASCGAATASAVRSSRYSSACSCGGITQTTTTAATPTVIVQCPSDAPFRCNDQCRSQDSLNNDKFNCGTCGNKCPTGQSCRNGQCYQPNPCPPDNFCSGNRGDCYCYRTSEGAGFCATNGGTCGRLCGNSDDCPNNSVCLPDCGACSTQQFIDSCPSGSNAKMLFARLAKAAAAKNGRKVERGNGLPWHDVDSE